MERGVYDKTSISIKWGTLERLRGLKLVFKKVNMDEVVNMLINEYIGTLQIIKVKLPLLTYLETYDIGVTIGEENE